MKQFFGTDEISFMDCGTVLPAGTTCSDATPTFRWYTSFSQAADENAFSRILIGYHFRTSVETGTEYGRKIGRRKLLIAKPLRLSVSRVERIERVLDSRFPVA